MNHNYLKETLLQACKDIETNIDKIVSDNPTNLHISIEIPFDASPYININKHSCFSVTRTDKIIHAFSEE